MPVYKTRRNKKYLTRIHKKITKGKMEAKLEANPPVKNAGTDVFEKGVYETDHITVKASKGKTVKEASLPVDVFIVTPTKKGTYPVLLFCHGWKMTNEWYSDLFDHIASHGYIIVAPQFYSPFWGISIPEEIKRANAVLEWLPTGIAAALKEKDYDDVYPDVENNLVVTGHSRGGKVAFALALGETGEKIQSKKKASKKKTTPLTVRDPPPQKFKAVIGIDPVGGTSPQSRVDPKILQYIPRCFNMSIPVAVMGAGLSNQSKAWPLPACAPDGVNHSEFFNESKPPVCYFLAREYGHFDMMNDNLIVSTVLRTFIGVSGAAGTYDLMRSTTGGIVVAFLKAYLGNEHDDLKAIVCKERIAPVLLDPIIHIEDVECC